MSTPDTTPWLHLPDGWKGAALYLAGLIVSTAVVGTVLVIAMQWYFRAPAMTP